MSIAARLHQLQGQIAAAAVAAKRDPASINLVAVSKTRSPAMIREAFAAGQHDFGENYLQEALVKMASLADLPIRWHFIGNLQANKTRVVAEQFDWLHTLSRLRVAERLNAQRPPERSPLNVCVQVNIDDEPSKAGLSVAEVPAFVRALAMLPRLRCRGLMVIPKPTTDPEQQHATFMRVAALQQQLQAEGWSLDTLSMGMSQDFFAAIAAGSTMLRIGTAIFVEP